MFVRLGPVGILAVAWTLMPGIAGFYLVSLGLAPVSDWLESLGSAGLAVFIGCFMITAGLGLLPTYAQAFVAGWVFGPVLGIAGALAGFTGASLIGFAVARLVGRDRIRALLSEHPRAEVVRAALVGTGGWRSLGMVTLVRIPPNSPFSLTNLVMAGAGVRLWIYLVGTVVGMTPRTAIVALAASAAAATGAEDVVAAMKDAKSTGLVIFGIVGVIVVLAVISRIANAALARATEASIAPPASD